MSADANASVAIDGVAPVDATALLAPLRDADVRTVEFGMPDVDGLLRGKRVPARYFIDSVARKGSAIANILFGWDIQDEMMDGLAFSGWHTGYSDILLKPDLGTLRIAPWEESTATVLCDVTMPDGAPIEIAPRTVLKRQIERARALGYAFSFGYELEFYLFRETPTSAAEKGYEQLVPVTPDVFTYGLHRLATIDDIVARIREEMSRYGIPIEAANTEYGPGQLEINMTHSDPLSAADRAVLYKEGVRSIAAQSGCIASFMAKVSGAGAGSSGHVHQSVRSADGAGANLLWDEQAGAPSPLLRQLVAGQLASMAELCLLFCPTVNSYKRRVAQSWAPTTVAWAHDNRTVALRAIAREASTCRVEHRLPGADANPYLVLAAAIAGALHGIEHGLEPSEPLRGDGYAQDAPPLPATLDDAIEAFERSAIARQAFGDEFVEHFLATRRWERDQFRAAVTDWERRRYFARV